MVLNLNAYTKGGDHQSGKGQRITIILDKAVVTGGASATGVNLTRAELVSEGYKPSATLSGTNSVEIAGVTYTVDATYDLALAAQKNVDTIFKAFAAKANIVYMDVDVVPSAAWYGADAIPTPAADDIEIEIVFEQKGFLATATKGEVSIAAGDNYGDSIADVVTFLNTLDLLLADAATPVTLVEGTNCGARVKVSANLQS